jgi:aminoglycoside 6'-N-acetyltransferase I
VSTESSTQHAEYKLGQVTEGQIEPWLALRRQLWPDQESEHRREMDEILASPEAVAFLLFDSKGAPLGFIEGALYLDGQEKYGYVEGWFVLPAYRRQGLGGRLLGALEQWILHHSISLALSDTIPEEYPLSPGAHARHGYKDLMHIQVFIKQLEDGDE